MKVTKAKALQPEHHTARSARLRQPSHAAWPPAWLGLLSVLPKQLAAHRRGPGLAPGQPEAGRVRKKEGQQSQPRWMWSGVAVLSAACRTSRMVFGLKGPLLWLLSFGPNESDSPAGARPGSSLTQ